MSLTASAGWLEQVAAKVRRRLTRARAACLELQGAVSGDEETQMAGARYRLIAQLEERRPLPYPLATRRADRRGPERRRQVAARVGLEMRHGDHRDAPNPYPSARPILHPGGDPSAHLIGIPSQARPQPVSFHWQ